jgi:hypothetical protein
MSQRLKEEYFRWWNQHPPKEGGRKTFILSPKNKPLKTSQYKLKHPVLESEHPVFEI